MKFTPEQSSAIEAARPVVGVSAGAGSGKTAILVERIFYLLSHSELWNGATPGLNRIAAITFTSKAASEMKARLRKRFREEAPRCDPETLNFWRTMEYQVDSAQITTIHSFCSAILRENSLHFAMDPDWKVLGDAESARLTDQALVDTLDRLLEEKNPAACRLALLMPRTQIKQNLKKMLLRRWDCRALYDDLPEDDGDGILQMWKASWDAHYRSLLKKLSHSPQIPYYVEELASFEGACSDPDNQRERMRLAYIEALKSLQSHSESTSELLSLLKASFPKMTRADKDWVEGSYKEVTELLKEARKWLEDYAYAPLWDQQQNAQSAQITSDFGVLFHAADEALKNIRLEGAALDFDDMINETLYFLKKEEQLCERVASSFTFLLIDEFQDTDERQLEIARLLTERPGGPSLFLVGDAKQSIYLFRGANVGLFNTEVERDAQAVPLAHNFRTLPDVLHFINDFFKSSQLLTSVESYRPMIPFRPPVNAPRVEYFSPPKLRNAPLQREQEAAFIAHRILTMCHGDEPLQLRCKNEEGMRPATYDDIVLLFRRGSYMHVYESALRKANIPYNRVAGEGFFKRREVLDILAMMQLILDPWDEEALLTVLRSPLVGLNDEDLMRLSQSSEGLAAAFHSKELPSALEAPELLTAGRELVEELYQRREWAPARWLECLLQRSHYEAILLDRYLGLQAVSNLRKLRGMAESFSQEEQALLPEFARYLEELSVRELREGEADLQSKGMGAVTIMTIHKSKGLEYPIVFLPELDVAVTDQNRDFICMSPGSGIAAQHSDGTGGFTGGGYYTLIKRLAFLEDRMEAARILYVAMTRARECLVLCGVNETKPFTWAGTMNRLYAMPDRKQGDVIHGDGWQLLVHTDTDFSFPPVTAGKAALLPDEALLKARLQPIVMEGAEKKHISVSALLEQMGLGEDEEENKLIRAYALENPEEAQAESEEAAPAHVRAAAMDRGTLFHRIFELWDFKKDAPPSLEQLIFESGIDFRRGEALLADMSRAVEAFRGAESWSWFSQARTLEREVPFMLNRGAFLIHGVADAVIDDSIIVDYKTGHYHPDSRGRYEIQLLLYGAALWKIRGILPERGVLWYVDEGFFEEIALPVAALEKTLQRADESLSKIWYPS